MSTDTKYRVITAYEVRTAKALKRLQKLMDKTERAEKRAKRAGGAFSGMFKWVKRGLAAGAGLALAFVTRRALGLNNAIEGAKISMASMFQLQGITTFEGGIKRSTDLVKRFKKLAITSPGESQDLIGIAQVNMPVLAQIDATNKEIAQFASRSLGAAFGAMGGDVKLTSQQILQILQGRGGSDLALFNTIKGPLAKQLGVGATTEALNNLAKTDPRRFFNAMNKTLAKFDDANNAYAKTFGGLWASISETFSNFLEKISKPLFEYLKGRMSALLKWVDENQENINDFAETAGKKLVTFFHAAASAAKLLADNIVLISIALTGVAARNGAVALSQSLASGGMIHGAKASAGKFIGSNVASGLAVGTGIKNVFKSGPGKLISAIKGAPGSARGLGSRFVAAGKRQIDGKGINFQTLRNTGLFGGSQGAALTSKIGGGIASAVGSFGTALSFLGTVILPLVVIVGMITGAMSLLKNKGEDVTRFFNESIMFLMVELDVLAAVFGGNGGFVQSIKDVSHWLGKGLIGVMGSVVVVITQVVTAFSYLVSVLKGFFIGIGTIVDNYDKKGFSSLKDSGTVLKDAQAMQQIERENRRRESEIKRLRAKEKKKEKEEKEFLKYGPKQLPAGQKPTIKVNVYMDVITENNPDAIAFSLMDVIESKLLSPTGALAFSGGE